MQTVNTSWSPNDHFIDTFLIVLFGTTASKDFLEADGGPPLNQWLFATSYKPPESADPRKEGAGRMESFWWQTAVVAGSGVCGGVEGLWAVPGGSLRLLLCPPPPAALLTAPWKASWSEIWDKNLVLKVSCCRENAAIRLRSRPLSSLLVCYNTFIYNLLKLIFTLYLPKPKFVYLKHY